METKKKHGFTSSLGFVLAAAGSAVGVGTNPRELVNPCFFFVSIELAFLFYKS